MSENQTTALRRHAREWLAQRGMEVPVGAPRATLLERCMYYRLKENGPLPYVPMDQRNIYIIMAEITGFVLDLDENGRIIRNKKRCKHNRKNKMSPAKLQRIQHGSAFYDTDEWRALRYKALELNGGACQCCGRSRKHGVVLHVDHIKPKSKFPELALALDNLQVLCEDCNLGKSNKFSTDWR